MSPYGADSKCGLAGEEPMGEIELRDARREREREGKEGEMTINLTFLGEF